MRSANPELDQHCGGQIADEDTQVTDSRDSSELDAVVGCISGLSLEQIIPWVVSLDACGFRGRKIIIHLRVENETVSELNRRGYETYDASCLHGEQNPALSRKMRSDEDISVNRFYYIWYFLSQVATARCPRYLMAIDVSDVIFQRNPSQWLEQNLGQKRLVAGCESLRFQDEPWGAQTMQDCYGPHVWNACKDKLIYNAGTFAGEYQTIIDLCLQVYLMSPGDRVLYADQQALNLLLDSTAYRNITCFAASADGWACQAGTTNDPNLLQNIRHHLTCPTPTFDGEFVRTAAGEIFTLVHQYNRVPEWDVILKRKYWDEAANPKPKVRKAWWGSRVFRRKQD
jgi:hypothetical protein